MTADARPEAQYYTDVLCVWAWISQARLEEVRAAWEDRLAISMRFVDVFGDAQEKIPARWGQENGFERFAEHVQEAGSAFDHVTLHPELWRSVRPTGSAPAHAAIKGAARVSDPETVQRFDRAVRAAFFEDGRDISRQDQLLDLAGASGVDLGALEKTLNDGSAQAALAADLKAAAQQGIAGSPTWRLNEGRQLLYGNVGYRIIQANLEEWLSGKPGGASWC